MKILTSDKKKPKLLAIKCTGYLLAEIRVKQMHKYEYHLIFSRKIIILKFKATGRNLI